MTPVDLTTLTPVEERGGLRWKREDLFSPIGEGSINGSKMRQCLWLVGRAAKDGAEGILSGASIVSPQLAMSTWAALQYDLPVIQVIGATKPTTAIKMPSVAIAAMLGAAFDIIPVAYNPVLQARVKALGRGLPTWRAIDYGISLDHKTNPPEEIEAFHAIGAAQVQNLPEDMTRLIIPAGSCNTLVSILYGLAIYRPPRLKHLDLFVIGPNKLDWAHERLRAIQASGRAPRQVANILEQYEVTYHDLHGSGYATYRDRMPETMAGMTFHPNYEGKMVRYIREKGLNRAFYHDGTVFWVVGSEPSVAATEAALGVPVPDRIRMVGE